MTRNTRGDRRLLGTTIGSVSSTTSGGLVRRGGTSHSVSHLAGGLTGWFFSLESFGAWNQERAHLTNPSSTFFM